MPKLNILSISKLDNFFELDDDIIFIGFLEIALKSITK